MEKQLEGEYYKQDFDPTEFFLERLGDANEHEINERLNIKNKQLDIITTKLSASVMKNYGSFVQGMSEIRELGNDIQSTAQICRNGRANLRRANFELISGPVNIIATQRKTLLYRVCFFFLLFFNRENNNRIVININNNNNNNHNNNIMKSPASTPVFAQN